MLTEQIVNSIGRHDLVSDSTLHVVTMVSNPARFHSRYRIFREWADAMRATANVKLHVAEIAFGDRHHEVTGQVQGASELQLRTSHEIWHKENAINLAVRHLLPPDWRYVAWVDADVFFSTPNWALETIHALQHYPVVQPWSEVLDLGPHGNVLNMFRSFGSVIQRGLRPQRYSDEPYIFGHSGFGWACTRHFWENVGGLMDFPILGSSDHHMCFAMINDAKYSVHGKMTPAFLKKVLDWQTLAYRQTSGHVGYVPGRAEHRWHGPKVARRYRERWQILIDHKFDPDQDLRRDAQGLLCLVGKPHLAEAVRRYFRERNEDSIDEG